jgi:NCS1 family nucleobase:cation symporter-1
VNPRAIAALAAGVVIALIGLAVPTLRFLYDYAWFVGFFVAAGSYYLLTLRYTAATAGLDTMTQTSLNE